MALTKKTVVTLKRGVDVDAFINEMRSAGSTTAFVPTREVRIHNLKPESLRNVDFIMTEQEAIELRNDPRVAACRWGNKAENGIKFGTSATNTDYRLYSRASSYIAGGAPIFRDLNWGLKDCYFNSNPFTTNLSNNTSTPYVLDGGGVDVVIFDTGLQVNHPEFTDANGNSRVQQIDWWVASGSSGNRPWTPDPAQNNMPTGFYQDFDGHGTQVGSIAVGKTYGWATNSNIYVMTGIDNPGSIPVSLGFNLIRMWHDNKPLDPQTGFKRPTIVNCSFTSLFQNVSIIEGGNYRGRNWYTATGSNDPAPNKTTAAYGIIPTTSTFGPVRSATEDAEVEDCIANGVVVIAAAGNDGYKIDVVGGSDYNNYANWTDTSTNPNGVASSWYYHRGATPAATDGVICVGAIDYVKSNTQVVYSSGGGASLAVSYPPTYAPLNATAKAFFSACGPRVDVYAPGGYVAGAASNSKPLTPNSNPNYLEYPVTSYYANPEFKQQKESGTSQAAPQVTGLLACILQASPFFDQTDVSTWISLNSANKVANITPAVPPANYVAYTDLYNLQGSNTRYLFLPTAFQTSETGNITGGNASVGTAGVVGGVSL